MKLYGMVRPKDVLENSHTKATSNKLNSEKKKKRIKKLRKYFFFEKIYFDSLFFFWISLL